MLRAESLRIEYFRNPIGLGTRRPRFSWRLSSDLGNTLQAGYRLQVSTDDRFAEPLHWDSGMTASDQSVHVRCAGPALDECTRYFVRVQVRDNHGRTSDWSEVAFFETGILETARWKAEFIAAERPRETATGDGAAGAAGATGASAGSDSGATTGDGWISPGAVLFRKAFAAGGAVASARVYATSLGVYELSLNGVRVGDAFLTPGWTNYHKRLQVQAYDVTDLLREGENVVGAHVASGWYLSELAGWKKRKIQYGDRLAALVQLEIRYTDGRLETIGTDGSWTCHASPVTLSEIYHGETYDARLEQPGWDTPGFGGAGAAGTAGAAATAGAAGAASAAGGWRPVEIVDYPKTNLVAQENEPVRAHETLKPMALFRTPAGETVLDMGQNMVGVMAVTASGKAGDRVVLKHFEVLDAQGNVYLENLRAARQTLTYTLRGHGTERYHARFTFMGFRYVQVCEFPEEPRLEDFEGIVLHSAMEPTGHFECSDPMVNQLQHNILWGLKGNFVDVPTDCPQRDERLGWTGDAQVFIREASFLMQSGPFYTKWLRDLRSEQLPGGGIPFVIPDVLQDEKDSSSGWGDAAAVCPWTVYLCQGDRSLLEEQFGSMKAWVGYIRSQARDGLLWDSGFHFGDWLALDSHAGDYTGATDKSLIATAFYAHSTNLVAKAARVLGYEEEERFHRNLHDAIVEAFRREFYTPSGRLAVSTQTAHVLALAFGLAREEDRERTLQGLVRLVEKKDWHLDTGFLGTPYLCHVLSQGGRSDVAYRLLLQTDYPSWLYPITKGATTIWEHWDGIAPDGSFWSARMNSFNHYAYGAVGDWMVQSIAGLDTAEEPAGYKRLRLRPTPGGGLRHARATLDTLYGRVECGWAVEWDSIRYTVEIPPNTTAQLTLPAPAGAAGDGAQAMSEQVLELGSGRHEFVVPGAPNA